MHPRTESMLERLRREEWFRNVGVRDTDLADVLFSWPEAVDSCASLQWENLGLEAANDYGDQLRKWSPRDYERWNVIVTSLKPATQALVREKTRRVIEDNDLSSAFINMVDWDILHVCFEAELADICPPGFYTGMASWYMNGHFPCGWRGPFPQGGRLVIF